MGTDNRRNPEELLDLARTGNGPAAGQLLESYRSYLTLLARLQIGRRLQGKADPAYLVQETFLEAHRSLPRFKGTSAGELMNWLRQILASRFSELIRRYAGAANRTASAWAAAPTTSGRGSSMAPPSSPTAARPRATTTASGVRSWRTNRCRLSGPVP